MQEHKWKRGRITLLIVSLLLWQSGLLAQPAGYYDAASGKTGTDLQQALHDIIDNHTAQSYTYLWTAFQSTDKKDDGYVWDMYSDIPGGSPVYNYTFVTDQCVNYSGEGDCYNREHSFPKSWFNDATPMYTDLFHLYPTDGYVNGRRNNYPYGETDHPTWTSTNGSKLGPCDYQGYNGTIFEPIDEYKGDLARTYFYMATRYYGEDSAWPGSEMVDGAQPLPWALTMLMEWHRNDPVSSKETDRNNAVYAIQKNRNPFIDHPEFVDAIWGEVVEPKDTVAPLIDSLEVTDASNITLWFSEILDNTTSMIAANYSLDNGAVVSAVGYNGLDFSSVILDVEGLKNGEYTLTVNGVADEAGNVTEDLSFSFTSDILGIRSNSADFSIYPNPASEMLEIRLSSAINSPVEIKLYAVSGMLVRNEKFPAGEQVFYFSVSDLQQGYYLLKGIVEGEVFIRKLIVE